MDTYSIEADGEGFQVRAADPNEGPGHIVACFPTRRQAQEWIDNQVQIGMKSATASDVA